MSPRILFVDDDPFLLQGLRRIVMCACDDWDAEFYSSAAEALERLEQESFDVVVSDMRMPGMDGAELLTRVRERHPEVIRLILSGQSENEALLRALGPAHQFLAKPCTLENLASAIERALHLRDRLKDDRLRTVVSGIRALPSIQRNVQTLLDKLSDPEVNAEEIAELVAQDLGMTAKILQFVNSPYFGVSQPVVSAGRSIALLGMTQVRPLVLTAGIFAECEKLGDWAEAASELTRHSIAVAARAFQITRAETTDNLVAEYAFLAGILHDVGKLVLMQHQPEQFREAMVLAEQRKWPLWRAEREVLQTCHAEIGAYLLGLWGLPSPAVEAVMFHHHPSHMVERQFTPAIAVHVADALERHAHDDLPLEAYPELELDLLEEIGLRPRVESWKNSGTASLMEREATV